MLQHWHDKKIISPVIKDHKKLYTAEEAIQVMVVAELRRCDMTMLEIRNCLEPLKSEIKRQLKKRVTDCWLAVDPEKGTVIASPYAHAILAAQVASRRPMRVIDLGDLVARLPQSPLTDPRSAA